MNYVSDCRVCLVIQGLQKESTCLKADDRVIALLQSHLTKYTPPGSFMTSNTSVTEMDDVEMALVLHKRSGNAEDPAEDPDVQITRLSTQQVWRI
jgi:hypothetical protein